MDKLIILSALNLTLFILNLWTMNRTLRIQGDIIKRDSEFILETTRIVTEGNRVLQDEVRQACQ